MNGKHSGFDVEGVNEANYFHFVKWIKANVNGVIIRFDKREFE